MTLQMRVTLPLQWGRISGTVLVVLWLQKHNVSRGVPPRGGWRGFRPADPGRHPVRPAHLQPGRVLLAGHEPLRALHRRLQQDSSQLRLGALR